jgi:hypothetical protein
MAEKKTFANKDMVGTPRGYVKKKDIERVDREMTPILQGATTALSLTPLGRGVSAARNIPGVVRKFLPAGKAAARAEKAAEAAAKVKSSGPKGRYSVKGAEKKPDVVVPPKPPKAAKPKVEKPAPKPRTGPSGTSYSAASVSKARSGPPKRGPVKKAEKSGMSTPKKVGIAAAGTGTVVGGYYGAKEMQARRAEAGKSRSFADRGGGPKSRQGSSAPSMAKKGGPEKRQGSSSPAMAKPPVPKAKPDRGKSKTRMAFEREFFKQRKAGKKEFTFNGKKYNTKLAK